MIFFGLQEKCEKKKKKSLKKSIPFEMTKKNKLHYFEDHLLIFSNNNTDTFMKL